MFIYTVNSSKLAESVQRDYRAAAEAHRLAQLGREGKSTRANVLRLGVTLAGLIILFIAVSQAIV